MVNGKRESVLVVEAGRDCEFCFLIRQSVAVAANWPNSAVIGFIFHLAMGFTLWLSPSHRGSLLNRLSSLHL